MTNIQTLLILLQHWHTHTAVKQGKDLPTHTHSWLAWTERLKLRTAALLGQEQHGGYFDKNRQRGVGA